MLKQEPVVHRLAAHRGKPLGFLLQAPPGSVPSNVSSSSGCKCAPAEEEGAALLVTLTTAAPAQPPWQNLAKYIWRSDLTPCVSALSCMDLLSFDQPERI